MMTLKPNDGKPATGRKLGFDKICIGNAVLNQEPIKEFIERMKAQGYIVNTTEYGVEITGDNLDVDADAHLAELVKHFTPVDEDTKQFLFEKYGVEVI